MAVIGATQLEPVNVLGSYVQGLEAGRGARKQRVADEAALALRNYLASAPDLSTPEAQNKLISFGKPGLDILTGQAELASKRATTKKTDLEIAAKQGEIIAQEAGAFLTDPSLLNKTSIDAWAQGAVQRGILSQDAYARFQQLPDDPATLGPAMQRLAAQGMTLAEQTKFYRPEGKLQEVGGVIVTVDPYTGKEIGKVDYSEAEQAVRAAGAPRTLVNTFTPASETIQAETMKELRDTYKQLKTAPVDIANLREAGRLASTSARKYMGTGGKAFLEGAKFLKNRLGVDVDTDAIVNAETARTALFQNVLNNLRKLDAQPSQEQQRIMQEALGNLDTDPDALPSVVQVYEDVIRGRVEQHNRTVDESIASGIKMPYSLKVDLPPPRESGKPTGNQFADEAAAEAAFKAGKIKRGDRIVINGVSGVWE